MILIGLVNESTNQSETKIFIPFPGPMQDYLSSETMVTVLLKAADYNLPFLLLSSAAGPSLLCLLG